MNKQIMESLNFLIKEYKRLKKKKENPSPLTGTHTVRVTTHIKMGGVRGCHHVIVYYPIIRSPPHGQSTIYTIL